MRCVPPDRSAVALVLTTLALAAAGCGSGDAEDDAVAPAAQRANPDGDSGGVKQAPPSDGLAGGRIRPGRHFVLSEAAAGFEQPLGLEPVPGSRDLYVVEQPGRVRLLDGGRPGRTLIDIRDRVRSGGEQGLLGLAFHPDFERNGRFFLHYSNPAGDTRVEEYSARHGADRPRARRRLLAVDQPYPNHNGGQLSFGPDGLLYLGLGDGGSAFDPHDNGQRTDGRLAKLLRIDVDEPSSDWRVAAYGLRNPWRFSWDRRTESLWIGDVGQDEREEIDAIERVPAEPPNFGWAAYEGTRDVDDRDPRGPGKLVFPVAEYDHDDGCSVTGGFVYRGRRVEAMRGRYVYGDVCSGILWTLQAGRATANDVRREREQLEGVSSFGQDSDGELYAVALDGRVMRFVAP